jgi:protein-disulfide isomerase
MSDKLLIPISILVAGVIIAGGFYFRGQGAKTPPVSFSGKIVDEAKKLAAKIRPVDANDHILGNPQAKVLIVEYSDTECPFCKEFHKTLRAVVAEYGTSGEVAWVYRHFPIIELHSRSFNEAEALECAGVLGGNAKFWEYTNRLYEVTPSNNNLPPSELHNIAKQVGLSSDKFKTCLESGEFRPRVQADIDDAFASGAQGTPFSVIFDIRNGDTYPINGAYPYNQMKSIIDLILQS